MRRRHAVALGLALPLVAAAPAAAAEVAIGVDDTIPDAPRWTPETVTIGPGDSVAWNLDSQVQVHDVAAASEAGYASWDGVLASPPAKLGRHTFTTPGRYRFRCQLHSGQEGGRWVGMVGTVVVGNPPPPPPPPLSEQPFANDGGPFGALETGGRDRSAPKLRAVRVRRTARGARISFRVSERARVTVRLKRGGVVFKTMRVNASGRYRGRIRDAKRLRPGRYRVELRAVDIAGNRSALRRARVTLR